MSMQSQWYCLVSLMLLLLRARVRRFEPFRVPAGKICRVEALLIQQVNSHGTASACLAIHEHLLALQLLYCRLVHIAYDLTEGNVIGAINHTVGNLVILTTINYIVELRDSTTNTMHRMRRRQWNSSTKQLKASGGSAQLLAMCDVSGQTSFISFCACCTVMVGMPSTLVVVAKDR